MDPLETPQSRVLIFNDGVIWLFRSFTSLSSKSKEVRDHTPWYRPEFDVHHPLPFRVIMYSIFSLPFIYSTLSVRMPFILLYFQSFHQSKKSTWTYCSMHSFHSNTLYTTVSYSTALSEPLSFVSTLCINFSTHIPCRLHFDAEWNNVLFFWRVKWML